MRKFFPLKVAVMRKFFPLKLPANIKKSFKVFIKAREIQKQTVSPIVSLRTIHRPTKRKSVRLRLMTKQKPLGAKVLASKKSL